MTKSSTKSRRKGKSSNITGISKSTAKSAASKAKKSSNNRTTPSSAKEKKDDFKAIAHVVDSPPSPREDTDSTLPAPELPPEFGFITNGANENVHLAPLSFPLTDHFQNADENTKTAIQGYEFNDRSFESEDDKEVDQLLKRGTKMLNHHDPSTTDWFTLFDDVVFTKKYSSTESIAMNDFSLNLAASDPLTLFSSEEFDREGNLHPGRLAVAWLAATATHGSVHLYYDIHLHRNRLSARTFDDMLEDDDEYRVPVGASDLVAWHKLPTPEKQNAQAFTYSQRLGEDAQARSIPEILVSFHMILNEDEENMTVEKWTRAFSIATTKGSIHYSTPNGKELRLLSSALALSAPKKLFMAHEWVRATHLRPQPHANAWLGAVAVFGPLWRQHDALLAEVIHDMNISEVDSSDDDTADTSDAEIEATAMSQASASDDDDDDNEDADDQDDDADDDDDSAATAHAGKDTLQQQKLTGQYRAHQLRYDIRFFVEPSQEADKTMIKAAKKFFLKAKEMDPKLVIFPWYKNSSSPKIKEAKAIPEQMGAFKSYFHQAQPKVAGGFLYMRIWLGHDKDPDMLQEDLLWWMRDQKFGLYPRSVQAENISSIGWLLYSTRAMDCASLQAAIEKRLDNKFEVGCRYKMISLGRRGPVPKENQVKAIHIECDSAAQFDVKVALSKIYASAKNDDYPNGIRMRLVPEINSMISPETRQNVTRLRARQDNFQDQIADSISWDIEALDFVDPRLGRSLRELIMKIESRTVPKQPLFHFVDQTWNKNGYHFAFFPNVDSEARTMIMSLIPFLRHHYQESITKWFSSTAQSRALGASWDPDKGCVKTFEDGAVSWMMTEDGFDAFDKPAVAPAESATRPDPSNLQAAAGAAPGLIDDQDSVGTFGTTGSARAPPTATPAQLVTGATANPGPRILPAHTGSPTASVGSSSSRSSITASIFSRMSLIEGSLAKVDKLDAMMQLIASKLGLLPDLALTPGVALVPPTPNATPPATVHVHAPARPPTPAAPATQLDYVSKPNSANVSSPPRPGDVRPLTHEGTSPNPRTLDEIRQSSPDTVNADASSTSVGPAG